MHGKRNRRELAQLVGIMDCVRPSRVEAFGMVVVEALAAGVPAIVTPQVGAAEIIVAGENGWIVPVNSPVALAKQMSSCCAEPNRAREMRPNCIASAAKHQWVDYRKQILTILEALIGPPRQMAEAP
jgi:starch synthase